MESCQGVCILQAKSNESLVEQVELQLYFLVELDGVVLVLDLHYHLLVVRLFMAEVLAMVEVELELAQLGQALEHQVQELELLQVEQQAFLKYECLQLFQDALHVPMMRVQVEHQLFQNYQALLE